MINGDSCLREFGRFRLDVKKRVLWYESEPVNLPLKEIELLSVLTENSGQVVTKDELLDRVWADTFVEESNLSRHIYLLRKTLKEYGEGEDLIQTVPRRGYRFTGQVSATETETTEAIVLERRTSTTTRIEIDQDDASAAPAQPVGVPGPPSRRAIGLIFACTLIFIGAALAFVYWPSQAIDSKSEIKSIAVLPVRSFAQDSDDEELRLRITDALITRLGGMSRVAVRPTSAVLPFAGSSIDGVEIGKKLRVDVVIDSYIQREGDRLPVTVQVIRVANGDQMWSEQFDGQADQILRLQDSISAEVARSLGSGTVDRKAFDKRPTENPESYEAYLKARYFATKRDETSLRKAIALFTQAKELDPTFSEAYSGLADTIHLLFNYSIDVRPEIVVQAKQELAKAIELKPDSADALVTLGTIQMGYDWDWKAAEESLKRAIDAAPNSSLARMRLGALFVRTRRFEESQREFARAIELDPLSQTANTNLGMALFCQKSFDAAEMQYGKAMELDDKVGATHWLLSRSLWQQGRKNEAVKQIVQGLTLDGNTELAKKIEAAKGIPENAIRLLLNEWRSNPQRTNPHNLAYLSTYLEDKENALRWLNVSYEERHPWTTWAAAAPEFESLRGEPRYKDLLDKLNLPGK
ncbi:MAG: tetratricopeptide repeat protein [Acidobacteria bacterium]|nr:tetratricopeptide repeat protein [Acidobacteriota bacterium]